MKTTWRDDGDGDIISLNVRDAKSLTIRDADDGTWKVEADGVIIAEVHAIGRGRLAPPRIELRKPE